MALSEAVINKDLDDPKLRKRLTQFRSDRDLPEAFTQPGSNRGKMKPFQCWIGVTLAAKKMAKKGMRAAHAEETCQIVHNRIDSAEQANKSMRIRGKEISKHNSECRAREKELRLGTTKEQQAARMNYIAKIEKDNEASWIDGAEIMPMPQTVENFPPEEGGPVHTYFGRIKNTGYLGEELRAIYREYGSGRKPRK